MATKISQLPEANNATPDDLLLIVNDPSGVPSSQKINVQNFFSNINVDVSFSSITTNNAIFTSVTTQDFYIANTFTPVTSNDSVQAGRIWFDSNYLYIAVSNNNIKRILLEAF